ncbi:MAG: hypothetical protein IJ017_04330 [Oscillospiraceae bacterium]|nr:hypothetical protein [Oscillospiraceae bacterium]
MKCAAITFDGNSLTVKNFDYHRLDGYYDIAFDVEVKSGNFSGIAPFEYNMRMFKKFISDLERMYDFKKPLVEFNDIEYGNKFSLEMSKTGRIKVSGDVFDCGREHELKFGFYADQTMLKVFIEELKQLVTECE